MKHSEFLKKVLMLHLLRLVNYETRKNSYELKEKIVNLRRASIVALLAIEYFKKHIPDFIGKTEKYVAKEIKKFCRKKGYKQGFPLLVGSGKNTCNIHARPTDRIIQKNDIVMIDIGLKRASHYFSDYCSDLTRTIFIGTPTDFQKEIYKIVQNAHDLALTKVKDGVRGNILHNLVVKFLRSYDYEMPHGLGHSTRRYTHSTPFLSSYDLNSIIKTNDHITIEPGIYLTENHPKLPKGHTPFGIRIEDLVLVKQDHYICLTSNKKIKIF